jgi:predicted lipid-binding transport protein (Tim44 family)
MLMISVKLFELLFFAIISMVLINRLLSILGEIDEDDKQPSKNGKKPSSFFDQAGDVIDVTETATEAQNKKVEALFALFVNEDAELATKMVKAAKILGDFDKENFLQGAKAAFIMIVDAVVKKDEKTVIQLVDKRYIEEFKEISNSFCAMDYQNLEAKVVDVNVFGNNVMVQVSFLVEDFNQFWTFTKSGISRDPNWFLTNVDLSRTV